ncbi:MAG: hypothetical protein MI867_30185 [Pseudomonadales bacterium]|nr:hypothetical protein [Pseudomonadales bacterium]
MANDAKQQRKQQILAHARAIISEQGAAALHMKELALAWASICCLRCCFASFAKV